MTKKICLGAGNLFLVIFLGLGATIHFSEKPVLLEDIPFGKAVLDSKGALLKLAMASDERYRLPVRLNNIPEYAINALVKYEDQYFYAHPGVNPLAILRGLLGMSRHGRKMGASTITMQVARLKGRLVTNTFSGKLKQIWHALLLERHYSKDEILEAYFTLAPYGGNIEGIEAAALVYFNKSASRLSPLEIQALTVIPQNPVKRNPLGGSHFMAARNRLRSLLDERDGPLPALAIRGSALLPACAPHFANEMDEKVQNAIINTTLEKDLQEMLDAIVKSYVERGARQNVRNAAAIIVNADTMNIVASVGSGGFFNAEISGQIDGTRVKRSPGSTLKPFIYALALDQGHIHPASILPDSPRSFGGYDPENFDRGFRGPIAAADALRASRNLPAIFLAEKLKNPALYEFLQSAGITFPHGPEHYGLALALGGAELTMRDLAALYAMLINSGMWRPLKTLINTPSPAPERLLSPEAAWLALWMLENPDFQITSRGRYIPLRFKTGTSNGLRDAWTAGTLGNYVIIAWIGNFDNSANPLFIGAKTALPLFQEIASSLASIRRINERQQELYEKLNLEKAAICRATGDFAKGQCEDEAETIYIPGKAPSRDTGILRPILIDPESGLRACRKVPGKTLKKYWEFWPSDLKKIFAEAGIDKPDPPEWLAECEGQKQPNISPAPSILSPKRNVIYYRRLDENNFKIPLLAAADSEAGQIHWYAGNNYIGKSMPGEVIFWHPETGARTEISAVDESGRSSRVNCVIEVIKNSSRKR